MTANPNTLEMSEVWNKNYQMVHDKVPVYPAISNYRLASGLQTGDTVHRQYPSSFVAKTMGDNGSYATQAITDTKESLTIDKVYETSFYVKDLDLLQADLPLMNKYAERSMIAIYNQIDGDILGLYDQFTQTLDDGDLGGTAGLGLTVTTANVKKMFFTAKRLLQKSNVLLDNSSTFQQPGGDSQISGGMPVAVISPEVYQNLLEAVDGKDTVFGDKVASSGHMGSFGGFQLFVTNALGWSATLVLSTIPTANDTIIINGVTLTAVANGTATNAGEFSISTTNDLAGANLVLLINGTGTAGSSTYVDVSASNRLLLKNITATYTASADTLTLKATGWGSIAVSETLTPALDVWTTTKQVQHCLFGLSNSIDVVLQKEPSKKVRPAPSAVVGDDVITWSAGGYKVFNEGKLQMIDAWVRTDAY